MEFLNVANNQSERICKMYLTRLLGGMIVSTSMMSAASVLISSMGGNSFDGTQQFRLFNVTLVWIIFHFNYTRMTASALDLES